MREKDAPASATAYCPVCWGTGELYRIPTRSGGEVHSCSSCSPPVEDWEPYLCARCTGSGLVPAVPRTEVAGEHANGG